jgi:hypothetical protein
VGRKPGRADLAIPDDALTSAEHLRIRFADGHYLVEDLHSRNGSFVGPRGGLKVRPGQAFRVGNHRFRFSPDQPFSEGEKPCPGFAFAEDSR